MIFYIKGNKWKEMHFVISVSNEMEDLTLSLNQFEDHKIKVKEEEHEMKERKKMCL
jgi:hypothetical protein